MLCWKRPKSLENPSKYLGSKNAILTNALVVLQEICAAAAAGTDWLTLHQCDVNITSLILTFHWWLCLLETSRTDSCGKFSIVTSLLKCLSPVLNSNLRCLFYSNWYMLFFCCWWGFFHSISTVTLVVGPSGCQGEVGTSTATEMAQTLMALWFRGFLWHVSTLTVSKYTSVPHVDRLKVWISLVWFIMLQVQRAFLGFPGIGLMVMFCQMRNNLIFHLFSRTGDNVFRFVFLIKCYSATACCACKWMTRHWHWRMMMMFSDAKCGSSVTFNY